MALSTICHRPSFLLFLILVIVVPNLVSTNAQKTDHANAHVKKSEDRDSELSKVISSILTGKTLSFARKDVSSSRERERERESQWFLFLPRMEANVDRLLKGERKNRVVSAGRMARKDRCSLFPIKRKDVLDVAV